MSSRYAVIDQNNLVTNVIMWDGVTQWKPPEGYVVKETQEAAMGDIWMENLQDYVRPLSIMKPPEDDTSKAEREAAYNEAKARLAASILSVNLQGALESF
jgi:hypothetical protein